MFSLLIIRLDMLRRGKPPMKMHRMDEHVLQRRTYGHFVCSLMVKEVAISSPRYVRRVLSESKIKDLIYNQTLI